MAAAGGQLGAYRLVTELGAGGMGTVYYAEHITIGRRAAIKVLDAQLARDPAVVARFFAEARAVNALRHPNIVDVVDLGQEDGTYYLVMELLEGETLGARLERVGRLDVVELSKVLGEIASALCAAHQRGMVHRDLKPENIFLALDAFGVERVKVLDFGIVKLREGEGEAEQAKRTQAGLLLGTPAYMSPEQCAARPDLDARADVYSLGVMAYEVLTGRLPFQRDTLLAVLAAHQTDTPAPPHEIEPTLSRHVSDVIMRALSKDRERRPATARAFSELFDIAVTAKGAGSRITVSASVARPDDPRVRQRQARGVGSRLSGIVAQRIAEKRLAIPSMPQACLDALEHIRAEDPSFSKIARAIEKDPLLVARAVQVASSSALGARGPITDVEAAIVRIGIDGLRALLVEQAARGVFVSRDPRLRSRITAIWERSQIVARTSAELSRVLRHRVSRGTAQMAGLLRGVGHPILAALLVEVERNVELEGEGSWLSEDVFDVVVAEHGGAVGAEVAKTWELPQEVADTIGAPDAWDEETPDALGNLVRLAYVVTGGDDAEIERGAAVLGVSTEQLAQAVEQANAFDAPAPQAAPAMRTTSISRPRRVA